MTIWRRFTKILYRGECTNCDTRYEVIVTVSRVIKVNEFELDCLNCGEREAVFMQPVEREEDAMKTAADTS